jgi:hypothetical protein
MSKVREDIRGHCRLLDAGNDLELPAAASAGLDLHPGQRLRCRLPGCAGGTSPPDHGIWYLLTLGVGGYLSGCTGGSVDAIGWRR